MNRTDVPITQSADERRQALLTAWDWGFDAAMDWRDRLERWNAFPTGQPMPEPQENPWRVET